VSANSKIEWTDHTFNPWIGCTKVSPGCEHCYAEARDQRFAKGVHWGKGAPRQRTSAANGKQPLAWDREARYAQTCVISGDPSFRPRVFCASLADWLDDEVPVEWLADLLELIRGTPHLDWLLLTKRPENWRRRLQAVTDVCGDKFNGPDPFSPAYEWLIGDAPANVWIGTTVEDQPRAAQRIPHLLDIPARVRFLSCEPLLGWVDFEPVLGVLSDRDRDAAGIDWVICGGESGPAARPMHPDWARSLRDQCAAAGVPFFFKQWGEWQQVMSQQEVRERASGNFKTLPAGSAFVRVGKKAAGRLLDGREWNEFPAPSAARITQLTK